MALAIIISSNLKHRGPHFDSSPGIIGTLSLAIMYILAGLCAHERILIIKSPPKRCFSSVPKIPLALLFFIIFLLPATNTLLFNAPEY